MSLLAIRKFASGECSEPINLFLYTDLDMPGLPLNYPCLAREEPADSDDRREHLVLYFVDWAPTVSPSAIGLGYRFHVRSYNVD